MHKKFKLFDINSIRPIVQLVLKYKKSGKALDLGSGIGRHALFLAKHGFKVLAVDNKSEVLTGLKELARMQKLSVKIESANVVTYQPTQKFDVVLSNMVLHFIPNKNKAQVIQTIQSSTKKEGLNVVSVYTDKNPKGTKPFPIKAGALKKYYEKAGWKILHYEEGVSKPIPDMRKPNKIIRIWKEELLAKKQF